MGDTQMPSSGKPHQNLQVRRLFLPVKGAVVLVFMLAFPLTGFIGLKGLWYGDEPIFTVVMLLGLCITTAPFTIALYLSDGRKRLTKLRDFWREWPRSIWLPSCGLVWVISFLYTGFEVRSAVAFERSFFEQTGRLFSLAASAKNAEAQSETGLPHISPKIVIINEFGRGGVPALSWLTLDLPQNLRASKPEEVGTVVLWSRGEVRSGSYGDGTPAMTKFIDISVIDRHRALRIGGKRLSGSDPPEKIKVPYWHRGPGNPVSGGEVRLEEVVKYIVSLPVKGSAGGPVSLISFRLWLPTVSPATRTTAVPR